MNMFTKIDDFVSEWTWEAELTERVLNTLTDKSLEQTIAVEYRTLGQIAWHLVESINYMSSMGLSFDGPASNEQAQASATFIADEYRRVSRSMLNAVESQWTDAMLMEATMMGGEEWKNGASLRFLVMHQAHHRGQMTVLMRQAGLRVPDVYGTTREDWIDKGLEPYV
jgi:uncharacterized damage-inducible protein DinB